MAYDFSQDDHVFYDAGSFGETALYQPVAGGDPIAVVVIIDDKIVDAPEAFETQITEGSISISLPVSVVGTPRKGDTVTVAGIVYTVDSIATMDQVDVTVFATQDE